LIFIYNNLDYYFHCIELKTMSARNMPQIPPVIYRRMSIHGEMPVHIHNAAIRKFNTFYKQPLHLGTIPENPEAPIGLNRLSSNTEAPIGLNRLFSNTEAPIGLNRLSSNPEAPVGLNRLSSNPEAHTITVADALRTTNTF